MCLICPKPTIPPVVYGSAARGFVVFGELQSCNKHETFLSNDKINRQPTLSERLSDEQ